ncbi:2,3-dihydroxybenzoate-AMP ligase [Trema orientale]|uniref:2,3-dihydroxybenzoate-AMP ligase n=1 Tax=Trema orientale TaxID=63057 RepID=A0A2P5EDG8_TREOI|nr:2,3-dihydroxybenzoate-AMP ligase [Trema orientale]
MNYENYDPSFPDQPVVDLYLQTWANLPTFRSKPAFIWAKDDSSNSPTTSFLTYSQLNDSVQSISSQLLVPLQRGQTVVVLCSPGLELVEIIFGCQRAGLLTVPIFPPDPSFPKESYHHHHLIRIISQTKPKAAIAHRTYITKVHDFISSSSSKLANMLKNLTWISTEDVKSKTTSSWRFDPLSYKGCKAEEVYLVQYTSGSTGIPKPVLVTAGSAAHNVRTARRAYDLHPNSVIMSWLPQYHDCGLMFLLLTIVSGATCVLTSPLSFVKRPRLWLELVSMFNATCTPVPSFALPLVIKRGNTIRKGTSGTINLRSLRNLIIINEPIYKSTVEEFVNVFRPFGLNPSSISPSYGLAENCTFVSTSWRPSSSDHDGHINHDHHQKASSFPNFPTHNKLLPSAKLAPFGESNEVVDMEIVIVNEETFEPVEDGTEGEILVSSPSNASGYLGHPSLTHEVFHGRLSNKVNRCFVRTGDRGVVKGEERLLFVTGRCLDAIKLRNDKEIHPHYIETSAYNSCPKFLRGGCIAAFKVGKVITLVGEIVKTIEKENYSVLRRICEGIREGVMKDEGVEVGLVVLVKSGCVPKTTSGKIQRWAAKEKLIGEEMSVVMEMLFGDELRMNKVDGGKGEGKVLEGKKMVTTEIWEENSLICFSTPLNRPLLISLL